MHHKLDIRREIRFFFFSKLDDVAEGVPARERVVVGADPNGHVGDGEKAMWIIWCERQEYIRTDD